MVKKLQKTSAAQKTGPQRSSAVKDSAQQIWLAGLGAFSKAQKEGGKVFDTLVKEGLAIQRKTQATAEEKISEATSRMGDMASDIQSRAGNRWDKLENIFEERVAKALGKLGVPLARDVVALAERIDVLDQQVRQLSGGKPAAGSSADSPAKPAAKPRAQAAAKAAAPQPASPKTVRPASKKALRPAARRAPAKTAANPVKDSADAAPGTAE